MNLLNFLNGQIQTLSDLPNSVTQQYILWDMATKDGRLYLEAHRGMYGLPQAGIPANN